MVKCPGWLPAGSGSDYWTETKMLSFRGGWKPNPESSNPLKILDSGLLLRSFRN